MMCAHRAAARVSLLALCALSVGACRDKTAPEPAYEFKAILSGVLADTFTGPATFGTGPSVYVMRLQSPDASIVLYNGTSGETPWTTGTFEVGEQQDAVWMRLTFPEDPDNSAFSTTGTLTITSASRYVVVGNFSVTIVTDVGGRVLWLSGSFRAKCVQTQGFERCGATITADAKPPRSLRAMAVRGRRPLDDPRRL